VSEPEPPSDEVEPISAEEMGAEDLGEGEPRRYPSTIGGAFYLVVLAVVAIALGIITSGNWRLGVRWFGGALLFAAAVRAVLPAKDAGMLAVRKRWWDCFLLIATGVALIFLAGSIPDQPGL
jgi:predicted cobalt transporter CbtA